MTATSGDEAGDQAGEQLGQCHGFAAEPKAHFAVGGLDMLEGEAADRGGGLCVEEHEQAGDPVDGIDGMVVQQAPGLCPAGLGVDGTGWAVPSGCGEVQAGQLVSSGPAHEVPGFAAVAGLVAGQPGVEVRLPGVGQGAAACFEPVEQGDGVPDVAFHGDHLGRAGMGGVVALP